MALKQYEVQAPDGSIIVVEGPEGADEATVIAQAQRLMMEAQSGHVPAPTGEEEPYVPPKQFDPLSRRGKVAVGAADAAATVASGALAMPVAGIAGLVSGLFGDAKSASDTVKSVSDALTWNPKSDYGKAIFEAAAPALEKVDEVTKDTAMYLARGNPEVATALETGVNAALILFGPSAVRNGIKAGVAAGAGKSGMRKAAASVAAGAKETWARSTLGEVHINQAARKAEQAKINAVATDLQANAKTLGIELRRDRIHNSVRIVAEGESATTRGAGFKEISRELNQARLAQKREVQNAWDSFRKQQHFTDVSWAKGAARQMAEELAGDGFNIQSAAVQDSLKDIMGLQTQITTKLAKDGLGPRQAPNNILIKRQELKELQAIREKLIKRQKDLFGTSDGEAVSRIGKRLDEMLDAQFKADAAKGIDAPWQAWKEAREKYGAYKDNWNEHKAIRDIIADPDMTPQKLANVIIGTSGMLGGKEASRIYDHIMMLTKDSPRVKMAVHGSVMYDLMKPLLDNPEPTQGHYRAVANNIRRFRKENPELVKSMGLKEKDLVTLQHAARAAEHTKVGDPIGLVNTAIAGITRHLVGHEIAQAGFRVRLSEKILNKMLKSDATSHREMLREFAGISTEPISSAVSQKALAEAMIKGELANQYQNMRDWDE